MNKSKTQSNRRMKVRIMDEIDLEKEQDIAEPQAISEPEQCRTVEEEEEAAPPLTQVTRKSGDDEENSSESRWSGMSITTQVIKTRKLLLDGLLSILCPQFLLMMEAMKQVQESIEVSSARDLHFLSLLERLFPTFETKLLDECEKMALNPILKKRFWLNIGEQSWREYLLKDTCYMKFTPEDMSNIVDCRAFFIRWLTEMREAITSLLSRNTAAIDTLSTTVNSTRTVVDASLLKKSNNSSIRPEKPMYQPENQLGLENSSDEETQEEEEPMLPKNFEKRSEIGRASCRERV